MKPTYILIVKKRPKWHLDFFIIRLYEYLGLNNQMMNHYRYVTNDLEINFERYFKVKVKN
ncbi:hypothetical protein P7H75_05835 [Vagococcus carniphilus]|uniref:hypothetical protein n=1 Tax=Vagococcus carniphilus TaxID=218144 RepID=UPI00288D0364|nr:hypothetical protein [Vagococcus carniphilus]MDT2814360.1 hypothetical protein [Vagococcus carniphilus]